MTLRNRFKQLIVTQLLAIFYYTSAVAAQLTEQNFLDEHPDGLPVSRLEQRLIESTASVSGIDQQTIVASGAREIKDLSQFGPSLQMPDNNGNVPAATYHGLATQYSQDLQVQINGRSVYLPLLDGVIWSNLPINIEDIERIQIIRRSIAALDGSDSFSAIINITTQPAASTSAPKLHIRTGDNGINDAYINCSGMNKNSEHSLAGALIQDDGHKNFTKHPKHYKISTNGQVADLMSVSVDKQLRLDIIKQDIIKQGI